MKCIKNLLVATAVLLLSCNNNKQKQTQSYVADPVINDTIKTEALKPLSGKININNLPTKVIEFIDKNYKGYNISSAAYDPLCNGSDAIDVAITHKGKPSYSLIFLPDGTFVQQEEDVDISSAPKKVIGVIREKYPDYKVASQIEKLTLADSSVQYLVDISKGSITKEVILTEDGKIVCESK